LHTVSGVLDTIRRWFRGAEEGVEHEAEGAEPVATPGGSGGEERETSTNAQAEGASGEPWPR
jgi:hypothetical protein